MVQRLVLYIFAGIAGVWIAIHLFPEITHIQFSGPSYVLLIAGAVIGILNALVKPILNLITFPIRILTLGLSSLLINMGLVWGMEYLVNYWYPGALIIAGIVGLFWTT